MSEKLESTFTNMVVRLLVIVSISALALGFAYVKTYDVIKQSKQTKLEKAIGKVVPKFDKLKRISVMPKTGEDSLVFYKAYLNNILIGTAIETYTNKGFGGLVQIMIGLDTNGVIINTAVLDHKETPGFGDKMDISKSDWSLQFNGKNIKNYKLKVTKDGGDVDAITGATISSRAFCDATQRAVDAFKVEGGKNNG